MEELRNGTKSLKEDNRSTVTRLNTGRTGNEAGLLPEQSRRSTVFLLGLNRQLTGK